MRKKGLSSHIPPQISSNTKNEESKLQQANCFEEISNFLRKSTPTATAQTNRRNKRAGEQASRAKCLMTL
jgi:hypothetical protein